MDWGYTTYGDRRHVLAEEFPEGVTYAGIALCGILLHKRFSENSKPGLWVICSKCETLLFAMESV